MFVAPDRGKATASAYEKATGEAVQTAAGAAQVFRTSNPFETHTISIRRFHGAGGHRQRRGLGRADRRHEGRPAEAAEKGRVAGRTVEAGGSTLDTSASDSGVIVSGAIAELMSLPRFGSSAAAADSGSRGRLEPRGEHGAERRARSPQEQLLVGPCDGSGAGHDRPSAPDPDGSGGGHARQLIRPPCRPTPRTRGRRRHGWGRGHVGNCCDASCGVRGDSEACCKVSDPPSPGLAEHAEEANTGNPAPDQSAGASPGAPRWPR